MNENESAAIRKDPRDVDLHEIANLDECDFWFLLMESRILQA